MFPKNMVKFFAQNPSCPSGSGRNTLTDSKCLSVCLSLVRGDITPAREFSQDKNKETEKETDKDTIPKAKSKRELFFIEVAKKYLKELKKQEDELKKTKK